MLCDNTILLSWLTSVRITNLLQVIFFLSSKGVFCLSSSSDLLPIVMEGHSKLKLPTLSFKQNGTPSSGPHPISSIALYEMLDLLTFSCVCQSNA